MREERREKRADAITIKMRGPKDAGFRSQKGVMVRKRVGPQEGRDDSREKRVISGPRAEGREQRKGRRHKRARTVGERRVKRE